MCGILGLVGRDPTKILLEQARPALAGLAHRGPDDAGFLVYGQREGVGLLLDRDDIATSWAMPAPRDGVDPANVVLGHRRLSIIDLSAAGHQPMGTADGRHFVILNGEIYNYVELRRELEGHGVVFRSRSDTEVLLAAWVRWGRACLDRLVGMFAFAILDLERQTLSLARDPFGMKPLYYARRGEAFAFASEISALLRLPWVGRRADPQRLYEYLDQGTSDFGEGTMFADVRALPAAHLLEVNLATPGSQVVTRYWEPDLDRDVELSFEEAAARMREMFLRSVEMHMRSDVRVGTNLSGGLDSSAIVAAMRHIGGPGLDIHTFSYIGDRGAISEERWIDVVAAEARTISHKVVLRPEEWVADLPALIESQDEPFGTIAIYAQFRLFREAAATGVRVVLNGQGADELLAGYRYMWAARVASLMRRGRFVEAARFLRRSAGARQPWEPSTLSTLAHATAHWLPAIATDAGMRLMGRRLRPWIDRTWCRRIGVRSRTPWRPRSSRVVRSMLWDSVRSRSLPTLLRYEDRNSMAHSVEGRLPFLTTDLAQFALSLPEGYLVRPDATGKGIMRAAMRGLVPDAVLDRRDKVGLSVPIDAWIPLIPELGSLLDTALDIPAVDRRSVAPLAAAVRTHSPEDLVALLRRPVPGDRGRAAFLVWRLAGLGAWARHFNVTFD